MTVKFLLGVALSGVVSALNAQGTRVEKEPSRGFVRDTMPIYHPGIDVLDYDLTITLPRSGRAIEGRAIITARRTDAVGELRLDLLKLRVDSVLVNGAPARFTRDSGSVRVALPSRGDSLSVTVRYAGIPDDGLVITDTGRRWMAFGDNWPNRARHWIPSIDHLSDKATVSWTVRAPQGLTIVANGARTSLRSIEGGYVESRWRESRPIPTYLMVIAAAPLVEVALGNSACGAAELGQCVPQAVYADSTLRDYLPGPFAKATAITDFFSKLVGPFPYEKLAHLQSSTRFGGMENASAIFYSDRAFRTRTMREGTIAHEIAHQWFGDAVTEERWAEAWLSEGFATYFEALWVEHDRGADSLKAHMARIREQVLRADVVATRAVIDTTQGDLMAMLNTNSYQKGGWVLHMLRRTVGDDAFFAGIRDYHAAHRHGNATSDDLRVAVEKRAGQDLRWFFDQWLRKPGFAKLATRWSYDATRHALVIEAQQDPRFGFYQLPVKIEMTEASGRRLTTIVQIPAAERSRVSIVHPESAITAVRFDPDVDLLATFSQLP